MGVKTGFPLSKSGIGSRWHAVDTKCSIAGLVMVVQFASNLLGKFKES